MVRDADLVLVMSVNPGFGGQQFIESSADKIARLRRRLDELKLSAELEVDGGINTETCRVVTEAGANMLVAGSFLFNSPGGLSATITT